MEESKIGLEQQVLRAEEHRLEADRLRRENEAFQQLAHDPNGTGTVEEEEVGTDDEEHNGPDKTDMHTREDRMETIRSFRIPKRSTKNREEDKNVLSMTGIRQVNDDQAIPIVPMPASEEKQQTKGVSSTHREVYMEPMPRSEPNQQG